MVLVALRGDARGESVPLGSAMLASRPGALARLDGVLHYFSSRGVRTLIERPPHDRLRERGEEPLSAFEFDRVTDREDGGDVLAAGSDGRRAWIVERDAQERPRLVRYDGVVFTPIGWPDDGPTRAGAAVVRAVGDDAAVVAVRGDTAVTVLRVHGDTFEVRGRASVGEGGGLAATTDPEGKVHLWTTADSEDGRRLVRVAVDPSGGVLTKETSPAVMGEPSARVVGALPPNAASDPRVLVAEDGALEVRRSDGDRDGTPLPFLAAWTSLWPRFPYPFFGLVAAFTVIGSFGRRRPVRPPSGGAERAAEAPVVPPGPIVRRMAAAAFDLGIAAAAAAVLGAFVLDPSQLAYSMGALRRDGAEAALLHPALGGLSLDLTYLFLLLWFATQAASESVSGRTLGKLVFGLRVVSSDGAPARLPAALTRSVLLYLDVCLTWGFLGAGLVLFTRRRQRLGDLLAGTLVVDARTPVPPPVPPS